LDAARPVGRGALSVGRKVAKIAWSRSMPGLNAA
jgi:hypothetical protein